MKVTYDRTSKIAGVGVVPWARLGLERWFDNYQIVSYYDWDLGQGLSSPKVHDLADQVKLKKKNAQRLVCSLAFQKLAAGKLNGYRFLTYRPVKAPNKTLAKRFMAPTVDFTKTFENKVYFRENFEQVLHMAPFCIVDRRQLVPTKDCYLELQKLSKHLVLQHDQLSGGKGTHLVWTFDDYLSALSRLTTANKVVVSAMIENAQEISVQACATKYGTITGPVQKQIIRDSKLYKADLPNVSTFCGAEVGTIKISQKLRKRIDESVQLIGKAMFASGYRGIFGVDFLAQGDELFVLEVNARLTGVTPLLTALYRDALDIPFYLLHVLEQGGFDYKIVNNKSREPQKGSLLILQNQQDNPVILKRAIASGVYIYKKNKLELLRKDINFAPKDPPEAILVQAYVPSGMIVKPGERLVSVIARQTVLNQADTLKTKYTKLVKQLYQAMEYQPVSIKSSSQKTSLPKSRRLTVGATVKVSFLSFGIKDILAKVDTGAGSAVLHTTQVREEINRRGNKVLRFSPFDEPTADVVAKEYTRRRFKSSNGQTEYRYVIQTTIRLKGRRYPVAVSLTDRSSMKYPVLLGSKFLADHSILVDLSKSRR